MVKENNFSNEQGRDLDYDRERLGELIKSYRKRKNIKLEDAAIFLMRQSGDLALIEQGLEPIKGNDFLNRNICKKYCAFIGIEDSEVSELIDLIYPISKPKRNQLAGSSKIEIKKERRKTKNKKKRKLVIIDVFQYIFVIAIILVAASTLWLTISKEDVAPVEEVADTDPVVEIPEETPPPVEEKKTAILYKERDANGNYVYDVKLKDPTKASVEISTEKDSLCYVEVYNNETDEMIQGPSTLPDKLLSEDGKMKFELKGEKQLLFNLGKTEVAIVKIDGETVDLSKVVDPGQNNIIFNFS